jgi:phosphate-selective porin OprO and OprP
MVKYTLAMAGNLPLGRGAMFVHSISLYRHILVGILLSAGLAASVQAQPGKTILLRNVTLPGQVGSQQKLVVNMLIRNAELDILTEDFIPLDEAELSYDAREGVVLGELKLGAPASFLVLDGDPAENVELLLDTKNHATFAIHQGSILKNTLEPVTEETPEERERSQGGWLAYTAPPLAVPLNYLDDSRWNKFNTRHVSGIFTGAVVLDRQTWLVQDSQSEIQVGDLDLFDGGEIRGLRFGGVGTLNFDRPWVWAVFGATHAFEKGFDSTESDDFSLFDLRLDIPIWEKASFSIGKQKEPISMERLMALGHGPLGERAAVSDALLPSRNVGVVMAGSIFDDRVSLAGGAFNNWLDKDQPNSFSDNATQFVGRATWAGLHSKNESTLLHLGFGLRHSDSEEGFITQGGPEFNKAPDYLETGFFSPEESMTYQAEASLRSGPFWLHGEYVRTDLDDAGLGDPAIDGYHVTASWILTGEVRPYNRRSGVFRPIPIARTVEQNGWGAWEISTRYSALDMTEVPDTAGISAGEMDVWSIGLNWWLTPKMNANLNYRYIDLDRFGVQGSSQGFVSRIMLILE